MSFPITYWQTASGAQFRYRLVSPETPHQQAVWAETIVGFGSLFDLEVESNIGPRESSVELTTSTEAAFNRAMKNALAALFFENTICNPNPTTTPDEL